MDVKALGLMSGQFGDDSWAHNGSWFDQEGKKVGWGDIGKRDLLNLVSTLQPGEVFFVLGEHDSYWDLKSQGNKMLQEPGLDFVVRKCRFFVMAGIVYLPKDTFHALREMPGPFALIPQQLCERSQIRKLAGLPPKSGG